VGRDWQEQADGVGTDGPLRARATCRIQVATNVAAMPIRSVDGTLLVGTQGWNYPQWIGPFFPEGTRHEDLLRVYARAFDTVEVDSTFYAVPPERTVLNWASRVPERFRFSLKLPQEITHERRFIDCGDVLHEFVASARHLGPRLGAVLMQCGPDLGPEHRPALERFLHLLPRDIPFAIEFRRAGWLTRPVLDLLREHAVSLALVEGRWIPRRKMLDLAERPTAETIYVRFMGPDRSIADYSRVQVDRTAELEEWAPALRALATRARTVYVYVNNHFEGHSPATVRRLQALLGQAAVEPEAMRDQGELF
jgi:uncharacterized protein YecE (DUF72 family)